MIAGVFHKGSGLGDQLFRYITVRTLAEEKGFEWRMNGEFKGDFFIGDFRGKEPENPKQFVPWWSEKEVRDKDGIDIRSYDPEINFIQDFTIVDGSFEDYKYWGHNLENINKWLAVEPLDVPDGVCVIGFRGGEYATQPDLFLPPEYYLEAIDILLKKNNNKLDVQVHTDDPELARQVFPHFDIVDNQPISHSKHTNMGFNWRSARFAKYAIIPNSAFFILPRLLKHLEDPEAVTIAPRYWARRNTKTWARPACFYKQFLYI